MRKIIYALVILVLAGCKSAAEHYEAFIRKGGTINPTIVYDSIPYQISVKGKDTTIYKYISKEIPCPETPKTNTQIRQENRTIRSQQKYDYKAEIKRLNFKLDSLKSENKKLIALSNNETGLKKKEIRKEVKENRNLKIWMWLIVAAYILGLFTKRIIKLFL